MGWPWRTRTLLGSAWKVPHGFSRCQQLQATGTAKFREHLWPAWRMDVSGYAHTCKTFKAFKKMSLLKSQVQVGDIARISASDTLSLRQGGGCRLEGWRPHSSLQLSQYGSLCRPLTQSACGSSPQSSLRDADGPSGLESVVGTSHQLHFHVKTEGPRGSWVGGTCASPSPSTSSRLAPQCDLRKPWASSGYD